MPVRFVISGPLRELAGNRNDLSVGGTPRSLSDALALLWAECPAFHDRVITERGEIRPHLNIFVDGVNTRDSAGFATPIREGSEIVILPALSGG